MALDINARFAAIERELENQKDINRKLQEQVSSVMNIKKVANECSTVLVKVSDILKDKFDQDEDQEQERKDITLRILHFQLVELGHQVKKLDELIKKGHQTTMDYFRHICDDDIDYVRCALKVKGNIAVLKEKRSA